MIFRPGKSLAALLQGAVFLMLAAASPPAAAETEWSFGGHSKFQFIYLDIPDNSLFRPVLGSGATDNYLETRLNLDAHRQGWKLSWITSSLQPMPKHFDWLGFFRIRRCLLTA